MRLRSLCIVFALGLLTGCASQEPMDLGAVEPVRVTAQVERSTVTPGKPFELRILIDRQDGVRFDLPDVAASIEGLVILDQEIIGPEAAVGRSLETRITKLKAPRKGTFLIPGVEAPWLLPPDKTGTAGTGPILIEASRSGGEEGSGEEQLRDLKSKAPADAQLPPIAYALISALILLSIAAFLLWRRQRLQPRVEEALPPEQEARQALATLRRRLPNPEEDQGPYAFALSAIIRRYLEGRFGFLAWKMTTSEVLRSLPEELSSQRRVTTSIREVLEATDRLKFGRQPVSQETLTNWVESAEEVVRATESRPELEEAS